MKPAEWCLLSVQEIRVPPQKYIQIRFQVRSDHFAWLLMLLLLLGTPQSRRCEFIAFKYLLIVFRELLKHQGGQRAPIAKASTEYFFNDIIRCSYIIVLWPETDVSESRRVTTFGSLSLHGSSIDSWMNAFHQKFPVMEPWSWIMVHDAYEICQVSSWPCVNSQQTQTTGCALRKYCLGVFTQPICRVCSTLYSNKSAFTYMQLLAGAEHMFCESFVWAKQSPRDAISPKKKIWVWIILPLAFRQWISDGRLPQ